ncbi:MAG: zinc-binding alcohol dehydrogenase family protein [Acidobacteria bacterium]|nr:zinc-binding alcohol dehydrogenase family protein [Acidobacteriota bacterium]MBI3489848.1 zinc-binding alcohol dehydrogenase family protein [Acidobacteriota bacterium]
MRAVVAQSTTPAGETAGLMDVELPDLKPAGRDLRVRVEAVSVNPVDIKVRRGRPEGAPAQVLGWDAAGVVVDTGTAATLFQAGDEVYFAGDVTRPGCNSEFCLVDERIVAGKPAGLDFAEAAALPLTSLTAYELLFQRMRIPLGQAGRGQNLLIVGGGGGVGSMAIQLAKAMSRMTVIATASRPESRAWAQAMGADEVIDHRGDMAGQLKAMGLVGPPAIHHAFCTADTDPYFPVLTELIAPLGSLGFIVPPKAPLSMGALHAKSITVAWELMFTRSMYGTADMAEQGRILTEVASLLKEGRIRSPLHQRWGPITAEVLQRAHRQIESGATLGKLVLEGWPAR